MAIINGIININKPKGFTSSDVVVVVKGVLRQAFGEKKFKVGHLGTLDPLGTGVLPISVGHATKLFDFFQKTPKIYRAGLRINETTDMLDSDGKITATSNITPTADDVKGALEGFTGEIMQVPPQYSALSVNGKRAYDIARSGGEVELSARKINIYNLELLSQKSETEFDILIECSSGTYIRSLMRDVAEHLGGVGYMSYIERIKAHAFTLEESVTLENFKQSPLSYISPMETVLHTLSQYKFSEAQHIRYRSGATVECEGRMMPIGEIFACVYEGKTIGLASIDNGYIISSVRLYDNKL